jgi:hypothetical protein
MSSPTKAIAALLALVASLALVACGGDDDDSTDGGTITVDERTTDGNEAGEAKPTTPTIVVRNGEPVGGVQELEYSAGEEIRFRVSSNRADEVHVHGYEVEEEIPAGGTAALSFPAEIEGIFEVELHDSEAQIAELRVNP